MYHLFENEMDSISSFNVVALSLFSVGSFLANTVIAIMIGYGFATRPLTEFGTVMLHQGAVSIGILSLMCFGFGGWAICVKKSIIRKIKNETVSDNLPHT